MFSNAIVLFSAIGLAAAALVPARAKSGSVSVTPHAQYSSSVGVLGCKIDANRVAYWPSSVDCDDICIKITYGGRSLNVLKVDKSGGAHDISYDAWNYLNTGKSATDAPSAGGAVEMDYHFINNSECNGLLTDGGKVPLSASNSMSFVASCASQPESWVAQNYELFNIVDPICTIGHDELCSLDVTSNQPSCPHVLGDPVTLTGSSVVDIPYVTRYTTQQRCF
ncbi:hypothetical protein CI238_12182 [Colletotrichum incanum]|uniref:Cerato-platanin n=1 Tax=Colletotrichum incanum TaxID=1573173 RepID=A0A162PKE5_COLIC|nr:hypothetical protein CI238_12182 [Colletotrichum incanum]